MPNAKQNYSNPVVSGLPAYVDQNADQLLAKSIIGADTLSVITIMTGIKGDQAMNLLATDVKFKQNAQECGFTPEGTQTISQRILRTGIVAVNMVYCPKNLFKKYAESKLNITAGRETLPFEEKFAEDVVRDVKEKLDRLVWFGDTVSLDQNLKPFDGFIKILKNEGTTVKTEIPVSTPIYDAVKMVLASIPTKAIKEDTRILCAPSDLRAYNQALVEKNLYHFEPGVDYNEITIPGTSVKLRAVEGLEPKDEEHHYMVAGRMSNLVYGCDMENGEETFKMWFSDDDQNFKLKIEFNGGVQVGWADEVVIADFLTE